MSFVLAIAAMLAVAGPASAHHDNDFGSDDPAGTISSFDPASGVLTIDLADGGQVSGLVTDETRIETGDSGCRHGDHGDDERRGRKATTLRHHHGDHGRGWHHGWGDGEGSSDDLVAGAVVDDAILILADGKATFVKVELADDSGDSTATAKASKKARH